MLQVLDAGLHRLCDPEVRRVVEQRPDGVGAQIKLARQVEHLVQPGKVGCDIVRDGQRVLDA